MVLNLRGASNCSSSIHASSLPSVRFSYNQGRRQGVGGRGGQISPLAFIMLTSLIMHDNNVEKNCI